MAGESRATVLIWVVAAALGVFALMRLTGSGGEDGSGEPVRVERSGLGGSARAGRGGAESGGGGRGEVYVHVAGAVRRPGLVRVAAGAGGGRGPVPRGGARPAGG